MKVISEVIIWLRSGKERLGGSNYRSSSFIEIKAGGSKMGGKIMVRGWVDKDKTKCRNPGIQTLGTRAWY